MRVAWTAFLGSLVLLTSPRLNCQQVSTPPQRDAQAVAILARTLAAAGGGTLMGSVQDFIGSGSVTYYWAGAEEKGTVTLRGRGTQEFRLDANLPEGTRSWVVSAGQGSLQEPNGKKSSIPFSNSWNLGSLTTPHLAILAAINDPSFSVMLMAQAVVGDKQVYDLRLQKTFSTEDDPRRELSKWSTKDYLIDPTTFVILAIQDTEYSNDMPWHSFKHQLAFSDYRTVNGVLLPFAITETIEGQQTWSIQLSSIALNTGLTDSIFQF